MEVLSTGDTHLLLGSTSTSKEVSFSNKESVLATAVQMFIPFLLSGFGMVAASLLLDVVQHWPVYQNVSEVYILVPALLGLKGNLEMTLASRLSTHANLGHLDGKKEKYSLIFGNLALIQCQAIIVGFLASLAAVVFGWVPRGEFHFKHALLLCAGSVSTAFAASFLLGLIMVGVILFSKYFHINPDNIATPIAASLGDLTTLALLSFFTSGLYFFLDHNIWLPITVILMAICLIPFWAWLASKNEYSREVLDTGWSPIITAMVISSTGGLILDYTVSKYKGIAVFQLIINGIGGNLVAVQASRISTELHKIVSLGKLPDNVNICVNPADIFCNKGELSHSNTARLLMLMVIPGHLIFSYTISFLQAGHTSFTPTFMFIYLVAALLQVYVLLYIAQMLILWMWKSFIDPDNSAIPYLTAIGDLLGTFLLGVAFEILFTIGDGDSDVGD